MRKKVNIIKKKYLIIIILFLLLIIPVYSNADQYWDGKNLGDESLKWKKGAELKFNLYNYVVCSDGSYGSHEKENAMAAYFAYYDYLSDFYTLLNEGGYADYIKGGSTHTITKYRYEHPEYDDYPGIRFKVEGENGSNSVTYYNNLWGTDVQLNKILHKGSSETREHYSEAEEYGDDVMALIDKINTEISLSSTSTDIVKDSNGNLYVGPIQITDRLKGNTTTLTCSISGATIVGNDTYYTKSENTFSNPINGLNNIDNNKNFYIKVSNITGDISLTFTSNFYTYEGSYVLYNNATQNEGYLKRGRRIPHSSKCTITASSYEVNVEKYITRVTHADQTKQNYSKNRNVDVEVENGDLVTFAIEVENASLTPGKIAFEINDTFGNVFEYDSSDEFNYQPSSNNSSFSQSGNTIKRRVAFDSGDKHTYSVTLKVNKSGEVVGTNGDNKNIVQIKDFKLNSKNINPKGTHSDSDSVLVKKYNIEIDKYIIKIGSTSYNNRNGKTTAEKLDNVIYAEKGDEIIYAVKINNPATESSNYGIIKNINLLDSYDTNSLEYNGINSNSNATSWSNTSDNGWSASTSNEEITLTYGNSISLGGFSNTIYINFKVIKPITNQNECITNSIKVDKVYNRNNVDIYDNNSNRLVINESILDSKDYFWTKTYSASIDKYLVKIDTTLISGRNGKSNDDKKSNKQYADKDDEIIYAITIRNPNNTATKVYGDIKNITVEDTFNSSELSFDSINTKLDWKGDNGNWSTTKSDGKVTLSYSKTLTVNTSTTIYVKFKFQKPISKTNDEIKNTANIKTMTNKYEKSYLFGTLSSSEYFYSKIYSVSINKYISNVDGVDYATRENNKNPVVNTEYGDRVEFKIKVRNTGDGNSYGTLYNLEVIDTLTPSETMELESFSGAGWSQDGNKYKYNNSLAINTETTLTLTYRVVDIDRSSNMFNNTASIVYLQNKNGVRLVDRVSENPINNPIINGNLESSDRAEILTYSVEMTKYISKVKHIDGTEEAINNRSNLKNDEKYNNPVEVEKYEEVTYSIEIKNTHNTTKLYKFVLKDTLEEGLEFENLIAKKYTPQNNGTVIETDITGDIGVQPENLQVEKFVYTKILNPGEKVVLDVTTKVVKTNLYLLNLKNDVDLVNLENKHNLELLRTRFLDINRDDTEDYVRLKELIISGRVWLDEDFDGFINNEEKGKENIKVTLYNVTDNTQVSVWTNEEGYYNFADAKDDGKGIVHSDGRVIKGTKKDNNTGNYVRESVHRNYYIEFEYNGTVYESTPVYSKDVYINRDDNSLRNENYKIDSNAAEFKDVREEFNKDFETISYNKATRGNETQNGLDLEYEKENHISTIKDTNLTENVKMHSYSFVDVDATKAGDTTIRDGDLEYLWLKDGNDNYDGETEYLKYINLGLHKKQVDIQIQQDLETIRTTINGEQMTYEYGKHSGDDYDMYITGYNKEGEDETGVPYEFNLYQSDYYYNHNMYKSEVVKGYKDNTELEVELTYKAKITNERTDDGIDEIIKINELADFYSSNLVQYDSFNNEKQLKLLDDDGFLENDKITITRAWYKKDDDEEKDLILSNTKRYGEDVTIDKYNTLYIRGFDEIELEEGESIEFYIKFLVAKDADGHLKIPEEDNIIEINAYSTYKKVDDNNIPAGCIDIDSNPGNTRDIDTISAYEDDTHRTGLNLILEPLDNEDNPTPENGKENERIITGVVWDDARTEEYTKEGEGKQYYADGVNDISKQEDEKRTKKDDAAKNEILENLDKNEEKDTPVQDVRVSMVEVIKIPDSSVEGGIKYYEETIDPTKKDRTTVYTDENGEYTLKSFIPGKYETHFEYGYTAKDDNATKYYSGQDYKSTKYYSDIDGIYYSNAYTNEQSKEDAVLNILKNGNMSDARDDEIYRLRSMSYSEQVTNKKTAAIRGELEDSDDIVSMNTSMVANTVSYKIRPEDVVAGTTMLNYDKILNKDTRYDINNIDFGLEYRPENSVRLNKYISNIKVKLSTNKELINIKYDYIYEDGDTTKKITGTEMNKDISLNIDNLQYLQNSYKDNIVDNQGFVYINVDTDLLQGATINIEYILVANNESEIDRISSNLDALAYRKDVEDGEKIDLYKDYIDKRDNTEYSAAMTARNQLYAEYYAEDGTYRIKEREAYNADNDEGYYGKYLGNMYYTGTPGKNDTISKLKIDKIIDYIDNDLTFSEIDNTAKNQLWRKTTSQELLDGGYVSEGNFQDRQLVDTKKIQYSIDEVNSNIALSIDDRISKDDTAALNEDLSKYLVPEVLDKTKSFGTIKLVTGKVLASETDTDDMRYDNVAEIVQYTSQVGRITPFAGARVGSVDPSNKDTYDEKDTSYTETVSLSPPTGLERSKTFIILFKNYILIAACVLVIATLGKFSRDKVFNHKKIYK